MYILAIRQVIKYLFRRGTEFFILMVAFVGCASISVVTPANAGAHGTGAAATPSAPAETIHFSYDEATGGPGAKGLLTTVTDASGNTKYQYDAFGRVTSKAQVV